MRAPGPLAVLLLGLGAGWVAVGAGAGLVASTAQPETEAPEPDFAFYKAWIAPIVHEICAECHADPLDRKGRHFLRPRQGRPVRERDHERNFETILGLITPGNPAQSLWLLKPLGPRQGGVQHGGGERIRFDSREYGLMVDFINGARYEAPPFRPPPTEPGQPDFRFFADRIEPVLLAVCAECHAERSRGRFRQLIVPPAEGGELDLEDRYANFESVLELIEPGEPERSRFLLKPLAEADGGIAHKGGDRIRRGDARWLAWTDFIRGVEGPPLPSERRATPPEVGRDGLVVEAEAMLRSGDVAIGSDADASGRRVVAPGEAGGGALGLVFRVPAAAVYALRVHVRGPGEGLVLRLDREPPERLDATGEGWAEVGPRRWMDGRMPLDDPRGAIAVKGEGAFALRGTHEEPAGFLSPVMIDHQAVEAEVRLPPETAGGDDVWLLYDAQDADNAKVLGLVDGGRRLVMGVLEGGVPRMLASADAPPTEAATRTLRVEMLEGVAIGRLDGRPLVFLHLDEHLGMGRFGVLTHGAVEVARLAAHERFEVHRVQVTRAIGRVLTAGTHVLRLELPPGAPAVDRLEIVEHR